MKKKVQNSNQQKCSFKHWNRLLVYKHLPLSTRQRYAASIPNMKVAYYFAGTTYTMEWHEFIIDYMMSAAHTDKNISIFAWV